MTVYCEALSPAKELLVLTIKDGRTSTEISRIRTLYGQLGDEVVVQSLRHNRYK
jgi:hypothetical protein